MRLRLSEGPKRSTTADPGKRNPLDFCGTCSTLVTLEKEMPRPKHPAVQGYTRMEDLLRSAKKSSIVKEVQAEMRAERNTRVLNMAMIRRQQGWSRLADKVVAPRKGDWGPCLPVELRS